jgi:hypothetical protein
MSLQNTHRILVTSCILINSDVKLPFPLVFAYLTGLTTIKDESSSNLKLSLFSLPYMNSENNLATCNCIFHSAGCTTHYSPRMNRKISAIRLNLGFFCRAFEIYNCSRRRVDRKHATRQSYRSIHVFTRTTNSALFIPLSKSVCRHDCY